MRTKMKCDKSGIFQHPCRGLDRSAKSQDFPPGLGHMRILLSVIRGIQSCRLSRACCNADGQLYVQRDFGNFIKLGGHHLISGGEGGGVRGRTKYLFSL